MWSMSVTQRAALVGTQDGPGFAPFTAKELQVTFLPYSEENSLKYWKEWQARADSLALNLRLPREPQASSVSTRRERIPPLT